LFLADLFIHGIGGGRYDEVTDALIRTFYEIEPPAYLVLSATLLLPLPTYSSTRADVHQIERALRDRHWNPQRHAPVVSADDFAELAGQKQAWIDRSCATHEERRERFEVICRITEKLRALTENTGLAEARRRANQEVHANEVLQRRDYAACLYPEKELASFYTRFLAMD
jgi:hypothetical protein